MFDGLFGVNGATYWFNAWFYWFVDYFRFNGKFAF